MLSDFVGSIACPYFNILSQKYTQTLLSFANITDHPITRENILDTNNRNVIPEKTLNSTNFLQVNHLTSFDTLSAKSDDSTREDMKGERKKYT